MFSFCAENETLKSTTKKPTRKEFLESDIVRNFIKYICHKYVHEKNDIFVIK